jgi:pyruvate dehydrogenase (quinone)
MAGRQPMKTIGNTMTKKRVADVLVDTVIAVDVKRVYELVGDSLNGVTESIRPRKDLQWVPVRHEETGQLTVCAGSCGPGNLYLINHKASRGL